MTSLRIGALEVAVVSDGLLTLDPGRMFGPGQPTEWRDHVHLDDHGKVPFSVNCLLVRSGERTILLDTGVGRHDPAWAHERYGDGCGRLVENLAALGIHPEQIDTVVVSHAHGDHVGGATEPSGETFVPTFPRATYWLWRDEWDHWMQPDVMAQAPYVAWTLPPLAEHGRVALVDAEVEVAPGVRLIAAPGHTPGHVCVALTSGSEMGIYTGDLLHHPSQFDPRSGRRRSTYCPECRPSRGARFWSGPGAREACCSRPTCRRRASRGCRPRAAGRWWHDHRYRAHSASEAATGPGEPPAHRRPRPARCRLHRHGQRRRRRAAHLGIVAVADGAPP
jgi:glyoxylase-like metal-dependent hydrolase (beta-lactamase superfamily II)